MFRPPRFRVIFNYSIINTPACDEFTVPLCRGHHRQLHQAGNEVVWWEGLKINALEIAKGLWEQTRPKSAPVTIHPNEDAATAPTQN